MEKNRSLICQFDSRNDGSSLGGTIDKTGRKKSPPEIIFRETVESACTTLVNRRSIPFEATCDFCCEFYSIVTFAFQSPTQCEISRFPLNCVRKRVRFFDLESPGIEREPDFARMREMQQTVVGGDKIGSERFDELRCCRNRNFGAFRRALR